MAVLTRLLFGCMILCCAGSYAQTDSTRDLQRVQADAPTQSDVSSADRIALVIGNSDYEEKPLKNPSNDARDIGRVLEQLGFDVIAGSDQSKRQMKAAVREFRRRLEASGGVGFFYYAGHGMQYKNTNFLIPIDADIQQEEDIESEAIAANWVLETMDGAGNKLNVVVLDACRNNPLGRSFSRDSTQGLAQADFQGDIGTLIAYATAPGRTAKDGEGRNSPYAKHLKAALQLPGLELIEIFRLVGMNVEKETNRFQRPWRESSLNSSFYFIPPVDGIPDQPAYILPEPVDEGLSASLYISLGLAAALAMVLIYIVRERRQPEIVTAVGPLVLRRENLGALYSEKAVGYVCELKTGRPLAPVLEGKPLVIGRSSKAGLTLHDDRISSRHAEVWYDGTQFNIAELESTNGTFVDGQRILAGSAIPLKDDASFYLGDAELAFVVRPKEQS